MTGNSTAAAAATAPQWAADFCRDYTLFLFGAGKLTLIVGVLLGIALAIATIVLLFRKKDAPADAAALANAGTPTAILEAAKAFLQALSAAPTWLALFGGGVLLLWLAGNGIPELCKPQPAQCARQCVQPVGNPSAQPPADNSQAPAGNAQ